METGKKGLHLIQSSNEQAIFCFKINLKCWLCQLQKQPYNNESALVMLIAWFSLSCYIQLGYVMYSFLHLCGQLDKSCFPIHPSSRDKLHRNCRSYHVKILHDDVIKWKHFLHDWPFVWGIHRTGEFLPPQMPVTWSFDVFFDLRLNKRLRKQWWGWWFETPSNPSSRWCNDISVRGGGGGWGDKTLELELVVQHKDIVSNNADHPLIIPSGVPLQWRHNECDGISNHQHHECLLNPLFRHRSKKISKLHVTGLCEGNSLVTCEFPAQRASKAEKVSILWCHHCSQLLKG